MATRVTAVQIRSRIAANVDEYAAEVLPPRGLHWRMT